MVGKSRNFQIHILLKADRRHPRDYPHTPPDYRRKDKCLALLMTTLYSEFEGNGLLVKQVSTDKKHTDPRTDATKYII